MKRFFALLLILVVFSSGFVGCGSSEKVNNNEPPATTESAPNNAIEEDSTATDDNAQTATTSYEFPLSEPVTMSMFALINGEAALPNNIAFQEYAEKTNVYWDVESVMGVDLTEKRNLVLASNQYPDVFYKAGLGQGDLDKYGQQGIFIPLNDAIEAHGPNIKQQLEARPDILQLISSANGNIYSLPEISEQLPVTMTFINKAWMDKLGFDDPTGPEELYDVLLAIKEDDPNGNGEADEIPYLLIGVTNDLFNLFSYYSGKTLDHGSLTWIEGNELVYMPNSEEYKDYLTYFKRFYDDGILHKDSFSMTRDQGNAIGHSEDILGMFHDAGAFLTVGRERDRNYLGLTPFEDGVLPTNTGAYAGTFAITDACENPDLAVAWADLSYTEEGALWAWLGVEGKTYMVNDDGTWDYIFDEYDDVGTLRQFGMLQGAAHHPSTKPALWFDGIKDPNEQHLIADRERLVAMGATPFPALHFTEEQNQDLASIRADIDPYLLQYAAQVITGEVALDASWDEYVATLDNMGLQRMMEIYNETFALIG